MMKKRKKTETMVGMMQTTRTIWLVSRCVTTFEMVPIVNTSNTDSTCSIVDDNGDDDEIDTAIQNLTWC